MFVCYTRCEACMWGTHPHGRHDWAGAEDIEFAARTGQASPVGQACACWCVDEVPDAHA
jgi:hypothetical protein